MTARDGHLSAATRDALLDRELDPRDERAALRHLLECRDCRDAHGSLIGAASLAALARGGPPLARGGPPLRAPRRLARIAFAGVAAAAAAISAVAAILYVFRDARPAPVVPPRSAAAVVVHSLVITVTRESNGLVSRRTSRLAPGGETLSLERSRERIHPAARESVLVASRRTIPFGEIHR